MSRVVEIPLSIEGISYISKDINQMIKLLESKDLIVFLKDKILDTLNMISIRNIHSIDDQESADLSTYLAGHKYEIKGDTIYVYNDSVIDIDESKFVDKTKIYNYPLQLSLAKIVEYGIGFTGMETPQESVENWEYDVNNHGVEGWYYKDSNGQFHWTNGYRGKLIFHKLDLYVKDNANKWINEYLDKHMK